MTAPPPFPTLLSPCRAGRLDLPNRLVLLPHGTSMVRDGVPTDDDLAYYGARAEGIGLVVTGAMVAHEQATVRQRNRVEAFNPLALPALARRVALVKGLGAKIVGQLNHVGRETLGSESDYPPVGASAVRGGRDPYPPHALDDREIEELIAGFAMAAANLQSVGYDGVELHAAHGYLLAQFLSPTTNRRDDRWGGNAEKRCRLLVETIARIRARCGDAFAIGVRLSADEETANGLEVRDSAGIAQALAATGDVDYLNITIGTRGGYVKDATWPEAPAARAAGIIRRESGLPVIVGQKIPSPELAERLLDEGVADMVGMARAFVADARFAVKVANGRSRDIRPCVGLNQDCRAFAPHIHCAVNPETGRERHPLFGALHPARQTRRVAVIGGGPGGMEAARVAALRGHAVSLFEASDTLGGQFLLAASLPHRSGLARIVDHLAAAVRALHIELSLDSRVTDLAMLDPFDTVVVATGATPGPASARSETVRCLTWFDIVTDGAPVPTGSGRAIFVDDGIGFWMSYGVAEMLAMAGWQVLFLTSSAAVGAHLPAESVGGMLARLGQAGTDFRVLSSLAGLEDGDLRRLDLTSGAEEPVRADLVVLQTGRIAAPLTLAGSWLDRSGDVHFIGDCLTPRRISHALFEAQRAARTI